MANNALPRNVVPAKAETHSHSCQTFSEMGASNECTDRILRLHSREPALWTLYIGVCNDISSRLTLHRSGRGSKFVKKYGVPRLVYIETYTSPSEAIAREKALKERHP